jgi:hypothetical protein
MSPVAYSITSSTRASSVGGTADVESEVESCRQTCEVKAFSVRGINTARMIATSKSAGTSPIK